MIRSMTGYGSATESSEAGSITVEARSVNSRGLSVVVKGAHSSEMWETDLRAMVERRLKRGRVDLFIRIEESPGAPTRSLDVERAREILAAGVRLRDELGVTGELDVGTLLSMGGILREGGTGPGFTPEIESVREALARALGGLVDMREREGERLEVDLRERVAGIRRAVDGAEVLAPERLDRERARLQAAVTELAPRGLDEERMGREIAMIADRWDVGEELVRARSHLDAFVEFLEAPADEPVGKRLGFLVQELQREINTLGAKANDTRISRLVVEAKNDIEKLREQIENVE